MEIEKDRCLGRRGRWREWERGGSCEGQTESGWEGGGANAVLPCQRVHSGHTELPGNLDGGVGRLCWIKGFSLCWIVCPLKHAELCIFSPILPLTAHAHTRTHGTHQQHTLTKNKAQSCRLSRWGCIFLPGPSQRTNAYKNTFTIHVSYVPMHTQIHIFFNPPCVHANILSLLRWSNPCSKKNRRRGKKQKHERNLQLSVESAGLQKTGTRRHTQPRSRLQQDG